tara:strand:+ start:379 stop:561 length:183 start_codon:yes stop_codon:yes gene_type:complete
MTIKIYTKTKIQKNKNNHIQKMYGVIEGPIHHMMKHFPNQFGFMRHETKSDLRKKKLDEQ